MGSLAAMRVAAQLLREVGLGRWPSRAGGATGRGDRRPSRRVATRSRPTAPQTAPP